MTSWRKAFEASANILLYSIGFMILGLVVIYWGGYSALLSVVYGGYYTSSYLPELAVAIVSTIVGLVIMALGPMAAFMKIFSELIESERKTTLAN